MAEIQRPGRLLMGVLMLAVLAWGSWLAIGSYLYNSDPRKPLIVLACVIVFVGSWAGLLMARNRRVRLSATKHSLESGGDEATLDKT